MITQRLLTGYQLMPQTMYRSDHVFGVITVDDDGQFTVWNPYKDEDVTERHIDAVKIYRDIPVFWEVPVPNTILDTLANPIGLGDLVVAGAVGKWNKGLRVGHVSKVNLTTGKMSIELLDGGVSVVNFGTMRPQANLLLLEKSND